MKRFISIGIIVSFIVSSVLTPRQAYAQELTLPVPGTMINLSPAYVPVLIKGLKVHPKNPLLFDFILDTGKSGLQVNSPQFKAESEKLIKYFLASLTIKEDDLWVNLSPYEKDRIVPEELGKTELGRDMLAQDYILKQLTASLIYPEKQLGKEFWNKIYSKAQQMYGTTEVPVNTFNKVWIVADKAKILERNNAAYVVGAHLKVMLESDYLSIEKHNEKIVNSGQGTVNSDQPLKNNSLITDHRSLITEQNNLGSQIIREIILPELEKEINHGQNFAPLRQMFYSMILASWYKLALKDALLNQIYSNKAKTNGVLSDNPKDKEKIYQQYLKAYKKGVFNYIKEDIDKVSQQPVPRKYFSGGLAKNLGIPKILDRAQTAALMEMAAMQRDGDMAMVTTNIDHIKTVTTKREEKSNKAMTSVEFRSSIENAEGGRFADVFRHLAEDGSLWEFLPELEPVLRNKGGSGLGSHDTAWPHILMVCEMMQALLLGDREAFNKGGAQEEREGYVIWKPISDENFKWLHENAKKVAAKYGIFEYALYGLTHDSGKAVDSGGRHVPLGVLTVNKFIDRIWPDSTEKQRQSHLLHVATHSDIGRALTFGEVGEDALSGVDLEFVVALMAADTRAARPQGWLSDSFIEEWRKFINEGRFQTMKEQGWEYSRLEAWSRNDTREITTERELELERIFEAQFKKTPSLRTFLKKATLVGYMTFHKLTPENLLKIMVLFERLQTEMTLSKVFIGLKNDKADAEMNAFLDTLTLEQIQQAKIMEVGNEGPNKVVNFLGTRFILYPEGDVEMELKGLPPLVTPEHFQEASERIQGTPNFKRLSDILGFTGMGVDAERKHIEDISVAKHDVRTSQVAHAVALKLGLNAPKASFIGLVHDYGALPFRHITMQSQLKQIVVDSGFNSKAHLVSLLEKDGFNLPGELIRDLLNFDIIKADEMSPEGAVAVAAESIEGVIEDILFGLKYHMISFSDIPAPLKEALGLQSFTEAELMRSIETDFDGLTVRIASSILLKGEISVNAIVEKASLIKQQARNQLIVAKIFNNNRIDVPTEVAKAEPLIMRAYQSALQNPASPTQADKLAALNAISLLSETDLLKGNIPELNAATKASDLRIKDGDKAMKAPGGIDFNAKNMDLDVSKAGKGIEMTFDPDMIAEFQRGDFSGIVPVIIRITPIASALPILGLEKSPLT